MTSISQSSSSWITLGFIADICCSWKISIVTLKENFSNTITISHQKWCAFPRIHYHSHRHTPTQIARVRTQNVIFPFFSYYIQVEGKSRNGLLNSDEKIRSCLSRICPCVYKTEKFQPHAELLSFLNRVVSQRKKVGRERRNLWGLYWKCNGHFLKGNSLKPIFSLKEILFKDFPSRWSFSLENRTQVRWTMTQLCF